MLPKEPLFKVTFHWQVSHSNLYSSSLATNLQNMQQAYHPSLPPVSNFIQDSVDVRQRKCPLCVIV